MQIFDISNKNLTSLKDVHFPSGITTLDCSMNQLTSLEGCPHSVTKLYCGFNQLSSLKYCPLSVTALGCWGNQLNSLEHIPSSVTTLFCFGNPLNMEYKNRSVAQIHELNKKKAEKRGSQIIQKIFLNHRIKLFQNLWQKWWYDDPDENGFSRSCKNTVVEINKYIANLK